MHFDAEMTYRKSVGRVRRQAAADASEGLLWRALANALVLCPPISMGLSDILFLGKLVQGNGARGVADTVNTMFRSCCLAVRGGGVLAVCAAKSQFKGSWGWCPPRGRDLASAKIQGRGRTHISIETPHVSRISPMLLASWLMILNSDRPVLTRFSNGRVRSARTSSRVSTLVPMEADILLASVDDNPSLSTPVDRRACATWSIARTSP